MAWIFEHLQIVLVVGGVIAYWIYQRTREKDGQEADYDEHGIPENRPGRTAQTRELAPASREADAGEQAERVRRIQEEIRRKIAERRGQVAPPTLPVPEAAPTFDPFRPVFREEPSPVAPPLPPPLRPVVAPQRELIVQVDDSAALERQRELAEQMEQLEQRRRELRRQAQTSLAAAERSGVELQEMDAPKSKNRALSAELRDPSALRRAMVLREVLGAPVALR